LTTVGQALRSDALRKFLGLGDRVLKGALRGGCARTGRRARWPRALAVMCGTGSAGAARWITVPFGCCCSRSLRRAAAAERAEDVPRGDTDESLCSSVAMAFHQEEVSEVENQWLRLHARR
jgi:hypothetical protein